MEKTAMDMTSKAKKLSASLECSRANVSISDCIEESGGGAILIYGAGNAGRYACDILMQKGVTPLGFFDEKGAALGHYAGIPVGTPDGGFLPEHEKKRALILLCVLANEKAEKKIAESLRERGYARIIPFKQKAFSADFIASRKFIGGEPRICDYKDEILSCLAMFADDASRVTYGRTMEAFCLRRFDHDAYLGTEQQYFPPDIDLKKGYSRFIDCGAYSGDTIEKMLEKSIKPEAIFAFEPDARSFRGLCERIDCLKIQNCHLYPCGVSSKTEARRFKTDATYSGAVSALDARGDTVIQCVALDDALKGVNPTFLKMDIEGAEYGALLGAKTIIQKHRPDLAISIYHYVDHFFEIPLLLNDWNLGYHFYVRTYESCGNETILYATSKGT